MLNKTSKCDGIWTRVNTKDPKDKSIIDYCIITPGLYSQVKELTVDDKEIYKLAGKRPTDHNTRSWKS